MDYNSSENQRIISKLVKNEVQSCLSMLVFELAKKAEHFPDYEDDLAGAFQGLPDYEEAARDVGWEQAKSGVFYNNTPSGWVETNETAENWEELCDDEDIEPFYPDIFEHWAVSEFMARDLEKHGHKIIKDFFGFDYVWCRPTCGQSIASDYVMGKIAEGMEILDGQEYSWKGKI